MVVTGPLASTQSYTKNRVSCDVANNTQSLNFHIFVIIHVRYFFMSLFMRKPVLAKKKVHTSCSGCSSPLVFVKSPV